MIPLTAMGPLGALWNRLNNNNKLAVPWVLHLPCIIFSIVDDLAPGDALTRTNFRRKQKITTGVGLSHAN